MKTFTDMQLLWLKQNCSGHSYKEITEAFHHEFGTTHTVKQVRMKIKALGLAKTMCLERQYTEAELSFLYINRAQPIVELTTYFNRTFRKDKSSDAIYGVLRTNGWSKQAKQERRKSRKIKVGGKLVPLDQYVWKCVNGPIPEGMTVIHLDNDFENNEIGNLKLAPQYVKTAFVRAGYDDAPKALAPAMYANVMLHHAVKQMTSKKPAIRYR
ncbi:HNH endonuclease [Serratia sp. JUb9]|uniref:HNH endonuclease n=1 Tax=Serratia sp. JUb9 TaxID=2724469 RepID=UPI00164D1C9B|nr:HNH endonuclease [Serratia sp. JUb9]QNK30670.1 HNH endonuclease [Serratia sp. JUb9]QPT15460.1 HNH endonuclease [Serratia rubidaea]